MISNLSLVSVRIEQKPVEYLDLYSFCMKQATTARVQIPQEGEQSSLMTVLKREDRESTRYLWDISMGWCTLKLVTWHSHGTTHFRKLQLSWREAKDKSPHNILRVILIARKRQNIPEGATVCMAGMKGKVSVCWTFILRDGFINTAAYFSQKKKGDNLLNWRLAGAGATMRPLTQKHKRKLSKNANVV